MSNPLKSELHYQNHTGILTNKITQPTEEIILERNKRLRNNPGAMHDLGAQSGQAWGRMIASIPFIWYDWALRHGYELNSPDQEHAGMEMNRFLKSPQGQACMIVEEIKRK